MRAEEQARIAIQSLLGRGLAATEVAARTGLERASEVWGGDVPVDRPGWYLWLRGSPGAYKLGLEEAGALGSGPGDAWHARFSIRYYPSPSEPEFQRFGAEERATVLGGSLDATGTPRIELASRIPESHFLVGTLEWAATAGGDAVAFALSALDRARVRFEQAWEAEIPALGMVRYRPGDLARDVAGWSLARPLAGVLAGLHAQVERVALGRVILARQPGFEWVRVQGGGLECRDTGDTVQGEALLAFCPPGARPGASDGILSAVRDPESEVVADEAFDGRCRHPASLELDARLALPVSHAWFGGEAHVQDRIACAC